MARLPRFCLPALPQHVIQRGNNRQPCFGSDEDFAAYAHWLEQYSLKFHVAIHAWVFMTNHVHLLLTPENGDSISRLMQSLGRCYVRYFNHAYARTGTLWEGRFKSCVIETENYLLICQRYIEMNPVRAGMVATPGDYKWSSFHANGSEKPSSLWTPHPIYQQLGETPVERAAAYRALFDNNIDEAVIAQLRQATNQGMALATDRFKQELEQLAGRRVTLLRKGPKP